MSNHLQHLDRIKIFQSIGEHTNLREASIAMSASWQHLLSELRAYGPISVETQIQRCGVLNQCGFKSSIDASLKIGISLGIEGVTPSEG